MVRLVDCLLVSHQVARSYLSERRVPNHQDTAVIPLVVKQETESLKCALEILLDLYVEKSTSKDYDSKLHNIDDNLLVSGKATKCLCKNVNNGD